MAVSQLSVRVFTFLCIAAFLAIPAAAAPARLVMLGDSITAGLGVAPRDALPVRLEAALKARGHDVVIANAGVSGDTAEGGLARLDWAVPDGTQGVIVALGANDMLRGISPAATAEALDAIVRRLKARGVEVMIVGMMAQRNLGEDYVAAFDAIWPALASRYGLTLHPFLLDGVALEAKLNQKDGIHPNAAGVAVMVERMLPTVERFLALLPEAAAARASQPVRD